MLEVAAYAATGPDGQLEKTTITRRDPGPTDVQIQIRYAGICHSDIHTVHGDWGRVHYPLVPGHEIVGTVTEVGSEVTRFAPGQTVGVGVLVDSCRRCPPCAKDLPNYCENGAVGTYNSTLPSGEITQGGYSTHVVVDQDFVLRIPDGADLPGTAPLLCAGITVYSPLRHWQVGPGKKVAVIGLGGLGHVAVKIAASLGAHVTVLSHSEAKRADALAFGAHAYVNTSVDGALKALRSQFDLIINTVSVNLDLDAYLRTLALDGTLVEIGLPIEPLQAKSFTLTGARRSLAGSNIGGIGETQEMLDYCVAHGITAQVEVISADQINQAYDRVVTSDVRYRFVIDTATI